MRHKVTLARLTGAAVTTVIFIGSLWCSTNIRAHEISWFGLSPEWSGRLGAGVFLVLFVIIMRNYGEIFLYGWIKDQKEDQDNS